MKKYKIHILGGRQKPNSNSWKNTTMGQLSKKKFNLFSSSENLDFRRLVYLKLFRKIAEFVGDPV
jgi:hypothetical protein